MNNNTAKICMIFLLLAASASGFSNDENALVQVISVSGY